MTKLVISVAPNGDIETLRSKNFDLAKFGDRKIERITEIVFDNEEQRFYINWLMGPYAFELHDEYMDYQIGMRSVFPVSIATSYNVMYFDTYEQAVEHEIACVNELRKRGISFT